MTDDDEHRVWAFDIRDVFRVALPVSAGVLSCVPPRGEATGQRDKIIAAAYTYAFTRLSKPP
jgi:hypothetical protein